MDTLRLLRIGAVALATLGAIGTVGMQSAHALQTTTWIDLSQATINIVDLNESDEIAPSFTLADHQSGVAIFRWNAPVWLHESSTDWTTTLGVSYASTPPGASGHASMDAQTGLATAGINGFIDGDTIASSIGYRASFALGVGTQATFAFDGRVSMVGADPYDSNHEAYAIIQAYFQDGISYDVLAIDYMRAEAWIGDTDETKRLSLTIANNGISDITGWLDFSGLAETISRVPPTDIPEPATLVLCLGGFGLMGLIGKIRRRTRT